MTLPTAFSQLFEGRTRLGLGLGVILKLNPISWWDKAFRRTVVGLDPIEIAKMEELKDIIRRQGHHNIPRVENADLVPLLINAIKELHERIEILEKKNDQSNH